MTVIGFLLGTYLCRHRFDTCSALAFCRGKNDDSGVFSLLGSD